MMRKWVVIMALSLLGSGGFLPVSLAQDPPQADEPFSEEMERFVDQYEALKAQSLTLMETIKRLKEDRERLLAREKALLEDLEESRKTKREVEDQYITLLETVRTVQGDRRRLMTDQTVAQKMVGALKARVESLERRQADLESELKESEEAYRTEQVKMKEASRKLSKTQKALLASNQANIDLQMQVAEFQSLSRESRLAFNYELGRLYAEQGKYNAAITQFQKTLDLDPNYPDAYRQLGEIYRQHLMRADLASPYFRRYLELRPEAGDFERIQGWLIKTKKEIDTRREVERWGGGFFRDMGRVFF